MQAMLRQHTNNIMSQVNLILTNLRDINKDVRTIMLL